MLALALAGVATPAGAKKNPPAEAEQTEFGDAALGRKYHEQLLNTFGAYGNDTGLAEYVQRLGAALAAHAPGESYTYRFTVLDLEMVNAFALPGGYIYLTRGLLAHLNNEAQLAAVLGHEIGHVAARHAARQHTASRIVGKVAGSMAAAAGGFNLGTLFGAGLVRGYGREMELEADQTGVELLAALGYDPGAMLDVIALLKAREQYDIGAEEDDEQPGSSYHAMLASHPEKDRRMAELIATARAQGAVQRDDNAGGYLDQIDGLAWAGSTSQGVTRGNAFYHLELDFAVTVPDGWTIRNLPDRVLVQPPREDATLMLTLFGRHEKKRKRAKLDKFLLERLGIRRWQNARIAQLRDHEAFIAMVPDANTPYGERLARMAVVFHGDEAFVFLGANQDMERQRTYDREFVAVIESFRRLDATEKDQARPIRIAVVEAREGDSFADLAAASPHANESLLRLLNGYPPEREPAPGTRIKVIR